MNRSAAATAPAGARRQAPTIVAYDLAGAGREGELEFHFVCGEVSVCLAGQRVAVIDRAVFRAWICDPAARPLVRGDFEMREEPLAPMFVRFGGAYILLIPRIVGELRAVA